MKKENELMLPALVFPGRAVIFLFENAEVQVSLLAFLD
jgi:hypothetical protein